MATTHSHVTPKPKFPTLLIALRHHWQGLQKNILLNDELGKHFQVTRKIIVRVSQGRDTDTCKKGLSMVWQHRHRLVLTVKLNANQRTWIKSIVSTGGRGYSHCSQLGHDCEGKVEKLEGQKVDLIYCTIKFNSSRGVTRDPKYHFVNSSKAPQLRDNPQNFVNPWKYGCKAGRITIRMT
jgi:hypothetical protein